VVDDYTDLQLLLTAATLIASYLVANIYCMSEISKSIRDLLHVPSYFHGWVLADEIAQDGFWPRRQLPPAYLSDSLTFAQCPLVQLALAVLPSSASLMHAVAELPNLQCLFCDSGSRREDPAQILALLLISNFLLAHRCLHMLP
jgi:hypothetical protein